MSVFKSMTKMFDPARNVTVVSCELNSAVDVYLSHCLLDSVVEELTKMLATAYFEQHGVEILKAIQEKTVDAKLIQKVVANLRKELKNESPNA